MGLYQLYGKIISVIFFLPLKMTHYLRINILKGLPRRKCRENLMKYESLEQRVMAASKSEDELEDLIREYMPYIRSKAVEVIPPDKFDQYSSGAMEAFAEAVTAFDESRGSFLGFASMVIKRRVTDQVRKEYKPGEVSVEEIEIPMVMEDERERAMEVTMFRQELEGFGIKLSDLPKSSPKHKASKEKTDWAARVMAEDAMMMKGLLSTGKLPVTGLSEASGVAVKLIEKKRKYIIARALLHQDKYGYLKEYIR